MAGPDGHAYISSHGQSFRQFVPGALRWHLGATRPATCGRVRGTASTRQEPAPTAGRRPGGRCLLTALLITESAQVLNGDRSRQQCTADRGVGHGTAAHARAGASRTPGLLPPRRDPPPGLRPLSPSWSGQRSSARMRAARRPSATTGARPPAIRGSPPRRQPRGLMTSADSILCSSAATRHIRARRLRPASRSPLVHPQGVGRPSRPSAQLVHTRPGTPGESREVEGSTQPPSTRLPRSEGVQVRPKMSLA